MDLNLFGIAILLGVYVGVVPVYLGLFSLPVLQRLKREWLDFLVCLTLGIMLFLFVDVAAEALEAADKLPAAIAVPADGQASVPPLDKLLYDTFGADSGTILGPLFMLTGFALGVLGLVEFGRRLDQLKEAGTAWGGLFNPATLSSQMELALLVSLGIGLHNLGEGLAVGIAYGSQSFALATVLIFGFAVHNVSEGIAIVSPISRSQVDLRTLALLGLLAGGPTIIGTLIGIYIFSNALLIIFFAIAAGAILYVVIEITASLGDRFRNSHLNYLGVMAGFTVMYLTSLLVLL
jgi:zinc transporter ZupT